MKNCPHTKFRFGIFLSDCSHHAGARLTINDVARCRVLSLIGMGLIKLPRPIHRCIIIPLTTEDRSDA
jgi:hypothetical protein